MMFQVEVFWVVTPCSVVAGYHHFKVHTAASIFTPKMDAGWST
jgi:hypothetical protein